MGENRVSERGDGSMPRGARWNALLSLQQSLEPSFAYKTVRQPGSSKNTKGFGTEVLRTQLILRTKRFSTQALLTKRFGNRALLTTQISSDILVTNGVATKFCWQNDEVLMHTFFIRQKGELTPSVSTKWVRDRQHGFQFRTTTSLLQKDAEITKRFRKQSLWQPSSADKTV